VLEKAVPLPWAWLHNRLYIDEIYGATFIAFYAHGGARVADWLDRHVWGGAVSGVALVFRGWAQVNKLLDTNVVDGTFDKGCEELSTGGGLLSRIQNGQVQVLSPVAGTGGGCAGRDSDLEQPGMSTLHVLTLLTVLPVVAAAIALFVG
jgi:hypothetical protein